MPTARLTNVSLEYLQRGHGPERVLFIHGFQASARIWSLVQDRLPEERYTSIAINNRGAGRSDAPPAESDFSIQHFAADAAELVTQLGWRDFTLVGHSLGGPTSVQFAVDHPELLKALVLLDPADPDGRIVPGGEAGATAAIDQIMAARARQLVNGSAGDGIDAKGSAAPAELVAALSRDMRAAPERRLRGSLRSMFDVRLGEGLGALKLPVLLCGGDADALVSIESMVSTWRKCPPGSGLHIWHGVGHSPNLDQPDEFTALLRNFIEVTLRKP